MQLETRGPGALSEATGAVVRGAYKLNLANQTEKVNKREHGISPSMCFERQSKNVGESWIIQRMVEVLRARSIDVDSASLDTSGELARADEIGRKGNKDCAYIAHSDDPASLWWMNWRTSESDTWCSHERLSIEGSAIFQQRIEKEKIARERELKRRHEEAAQKAERIYHSCSNSATASHPYSQAKGLTPGPLVRRGEYQGHDCLIVPIYGPDKSLMTLQFIADGKVFNGERDKTLLSGGKKAGGLHPAGDTFRGASCVVIGEGFATVQIVVEATGLPGVVAIDKGNLLAVAKTVREMAAPNADIIILADDDMPDPDGIEKASEAAAAIGGRVAIPAMGKKSDFWDVWSELGVDAVKERMDAAITPSVKAVQKVKAASTSSAVLKTICAADITPSPIDWLWSGWLALSKLHVLGGMPGTGKTTLTMALAATVTIGGRWPDGSRCESGSVVIWSGEDDPSDTLVPRLAAAGANLSKVHFVANVEDGNSDRQFDPKRDMPLLIETVHAIGNVRLLIVDPIVSAVSGDSHKNAEVRQSLQPLVTLATDAKCAVVGITHFTKGTQGNDPLERVTGSVAFGALPRVVMVAAKSRDETGASGRVLMRAKSNIGPDGGGFGYDLEQIECPGNPGLFASNVLWGGVIDGTARDILGQAEADSGDGGALSEAKEFLQTVLSNGPVPAKTVEAEAKDAGIKQATLRRAKDAMGIKPEKSGFSHGWVWTLPKSSKLPEGAHPSMAHSDMSIFAENEHLRSENPEGAQKSRRCSSFGGGASSAVDEHLGSLPLPLKIVEAEL